MRMDKEFLKKKVIPIVLIIVVSFAVSQVIYAYLFWWKGLYCAWLIPILWWLALLWVVYRFLKRKYDLPNLVKMLGSIKSKKIRIGVIALLLLPIIYAGTKGIARDIKLANARALCPSNEEIYEMVKEAAEIELSNYRQSEVIIRSSVDDMLEHKIEVKVGVRRLTLYHDKKYVFRYGGLKCNSDWTAVWEE